MTMLPALNVIGMRDGSEEAFGAEYNVLPIWKDRMDSRTWVPTPNADVIYSMSYLDLKETGPLVVNAPPNVIGMRSEEHTSELQSLMRISYAVFCSKKKTTHTTHQHKHHNQTTQRS